MLQTLEQKIVQPDKVAGIEVELLADGRMRLYSVVATLKKGKIVKEEIGRPMGDIEELPAKIKPVVPLAICFNGKGILIRKTELPQPNASPVAAVLPNVNPQDFYYDLYQHEGFNTISIARKTQVEQLIEVLRNKGYKVLQIGFGFGALNNILPFVNHVENGTIETHSFSLSIGNGHRITSFAQKEPATDSPVLPEYNISDQYIPGSHLTAFAMAVELLTGSLQQTPAVTSPVMEAERKEYRFYKLFRAAGMALLCLVFILLLVNFLIYNHYFSLNREMEAKQQLSRDVQVKTKSLLQRIQQKERFLHQTGWEKTGKISLYADRIASLTPSNTLLTAMVINPVKSKGNDGSAGTQFKYDTILVNGASSNPVEVNQFINNLKIIPEFKQVAIKNYRYKKEEDTGIFLIEIITR